MKNIKKFEAFNEATMNRFNSYLIMWNIKKDSWDSVNRGFLLSHLNSSAREDLIDNYIKGNIYDSIEYQMSYPNKSFEDIWGGSESPRFFVVRYNSKFGYKYYLVNTEGFDYARYVVRIDDLEQWVNIDENLYNE